MFKFIILRWGLNGTVSVLNLFDQTIETKSLLLAQFPAVHSEEIICCVKLLFKCRHVLVQGATTLR